jgi:hypothetical protein
MPTSAPLPSPNSAWLDWSKEHRLLTRQVRGTGLYADIATCQPLQQGLGRISELLLQPRRRIEPRHQDGAIGYQACVVNAVGPQQVESRQIPYREIVRLSQTCPQAVDHKGVAGPGMRAAHGVVAHPHRPMEVERCQHKWQQGAAAHAAADHKTRDMLAEQPAQALDQAGGPRPAQIADDLSPARRQYLATCDQHQLWAIGSSCEELTHGPRVLAAVRRHGGRYRRIELQPQIQPQPLDHALDDEREQQVAIVVSVERPDHRDRGAAAWMRRRHGQR